MKIIVDNQEILALNDTQKKVLCNDINSSELDADIKRRVAYIVQHKYEQCFKRLKNEWDPKLAARGIEMIPTKTDAYAELVFSQPDYKDRLAREKDVQAQQDASRDTQ